MFWHLLSNFKQFESEWANLFSLWDFSILNSQYEQKHADLFFIFVLTLSVYTSKLPGVEKLVEQIHNISVTKASVIQSSYMIPNFYNNIWRISGFKILVLQLFLNFPILLRSESRQHTRHDSRGFDISALYYKKHKLHINL